MFCAEKKNIAKDEVPRERRHSEQKKPALSRQHSAFSSNPIRCGAGVLARDQVPRADQSEAPAVAVRRQLAAGSLLSC